MIKNKLKIEKHPSLPSGMYYSKHPFLRVGLPFLTAIVVGTFLLADIRKSRYEHVRTRIPDNCDAEGDKRKKNMKSLEEELKVKNKKLGIILTC